MGIITGVSGSVIATAATIQYLATIGKERVPVSLVAHSLVLLLAAGVAVVGAALDPSGGSVALGTLTVLVSASMLYIFSLAPLPDGQLIATVGQPLPALVAPDQDGAPFDVASLKGGRVMVKFFRGSW